MNIQEAKQEIIHTVRAYLAKDASGNYCFPTVRQRPIILMGPPGIGKTAIMEQAAQECGVGLVAYTITHHTRQSAIGLPHITRKSYGGVEMSVTEYTMSEIIASVYETIERTGNREGILFLDEINCVSETLAPTMLQFLQNKTFGSHKVPEGWVIAAAGNPAAYNKSAREFDIVTLDRVRLIQVEADLQVWLDYARAKQLHGAVISYLTVKADQFYLVQRKEDTLSYVTARGWEDLSAILKGYETLGVPITAALTEQYLHHTATARSFTAYYQLYQKYGTDYGIGEILSGTISQGEYQQKVAMAKAGGFDERITVVNLMLESLQRMFAQYCQVDGQVAKLHSYLHRWKGLDQTLPKFIESNRKSLEVKLSNALISRGETEQETWVLSRLAQMELSIKAQHLQERQAQYAYIKDLFLSDVTRRETVIGEVKNARASAVRFAEDCFGVGQEMILLVSSLTRTPSALEFIFRHGCAPYLKYAQVLLYHQQEAALQQACAELM